jgi:hypothetical protein
MKGERGSAEPAHHLPVVVMLLVVLAGCTGRQTFDPEPPAPAAPLVAQVLCTEAGPRVETPFVRAQSDGVHFRVTNETNDKTLFGTEAGEATGPIEPGKKAHVVSAVAPGASEVRCRRPDLRLKEHGQIEVVDPEEWWIPTALDCPGGWSTVVDFASGAEDSPLSQATELLKGLRADDVVREAGYPQDDEAVVTVARDGRVVLVISFWRYGDDWSLQGASGCNGSGVGLDF